MSLMYCSLDAQCLEYFVASMDLLHFEIYFVGQSVIEEQQFSRSIMTGNSILQRMVCYSSIYVFVVFYLLFLFRIHATWRKVT